MMVVVGRIRVMARASCMSVHSVCPTIHGATFLTFFNGERSRRYIDHGAFVVVVFPTLYLGMIVATGVSCRDLCLAIESNSFVIVATKGVPFSRREDPNVNVQGETPIHVHQLASL